MEAKRILIVEDDLDNQELLKEIIDTCTPDYTYASVMDGDEAIRAAEKQDFDLVITDMSVPKKDGYEIVKALRKTQNYQSVPIIALTAHAMKGIREKVLDSGFNEYIAKPCKPKDLVEVITKYLESKQKIFMN